MFFLQIAPELNDMDSLQSAIDNGISMLNKCYEKVPLDLDDSDEEDDPDKKWLVSLESQFHYFEIQFLFVSVISFDQKIHIWIVQHHLLLVQKNGKKNGISVLLNLKTNPKKKYQKNFLTALMVYPFY